MRINVMNSAMITLLTLNKKYQITHKTATTNLDDFSRFGSLRFLLRKTDVHVLLEPAVSDRDLIVYRFLPEVLPLGVHV